MINRPFQLEHLSNAVKRAPITALFGPRLFLTRQAIARRRLF
jgi:hypothetical protein